MTSAQADRLVSADGHVNEPPDVWRDRLAAHLAPRAPRMESFPEGDAWVFEGFAGPVNFGFNAAAGLPAEERRPWIRWDEVPPRCYDASARVAALDAGGVAAELLYATPRIAAGLLATGDAELEVAIVGAYNDWLSELCAAAPGRLFGLALMPAVGADVAVREMQRALALPGIVSPYIGRWPSGDEALGADDDRFFAAVEEMGVPVSVHVSVATTEARAGDGDAHRRRLGARGEFRGLGGQTAVNCLELINSGVFDRFPSLSFVFAECESSWVPCAKQTFDDRFHRFAKGARPDIAEEPSVYFDRNIFTTFVLDRYAIRNRDLIGVTQMLWSNDAFHNVCEWPKDPEAVARDFAGVEGEERRLILSGNAERLYHLAGYARSGAPAVGSRGGGAYWAAL